MRKSNKRKKALHTALQGDLFACGTHIPSRATGGGTFSERTGLAELLSRLTSQFASRAHLQNDPPKILTETAVVR